ELRSKKIDGKYKYNLMQITIELNPARLIGKSNLDLLEEGDIEEFKQRFNDLIKTIHLDLPRAELWIVNRIDYAINIKTPYVEEYIELFQRADKPKCFKELYCTKSKRRKQLEGSFYLISGSVNINFYDKESQGMKKNLNIDGAKNLLRLEIQCKKPKINALQDRKGFKSNHLGSYLNRELSNEIIEYYYNKTIGSEDYYKLLEAITIVKESKSTTKTKEKLIKVLRAINKHRSIYKARKKCDYNEVNFNRYLKQLRALGINPVTIPTRWKMGILDNIISISKGVPYEMIKEVTEIVD
ncbi:MAG: hypothetical protein ACRC7N_04635, partial [Clostridium sp.]